MVGHLAASCFSPHFPAKAPNALAQPLISIIRSIDMPVPKRVFKPPLCDMFLKTKLLL